VNHINKKSRCRATASTLIGAGSLLLANSLAAQAQTQPTELELLRAQIAELTNRLNKLETDQKAAAEASKKAAATAPPMTAKEKLTFSGAMQVNGRAYFDQSGPGTRVADTFQLRRAEFRITANVTPRISGSIQLDPAKTINANALTVPAGGGTVTPTINQSGNVLQEMVVSGLIHQSAKNPLYVDIGQYKLPIGYEGDLVSSASLQNVDRALFFQARDPFGGGTGDVRDTGARLRGSAGEFDYQLGIFNGFGERQNALSNSDNKAVIGRLVYKPSGVSGLQLGISGGKGNLRNTPAAGSRAERDALNFFSAYKHKKLTLQAEYMKGSNQVIALSPGLGRNMRGYYAHVGYMLTPKLEATFRYDYVDFAKNFLPAPGASSDTNVRDLIFGLNYYIKGHNAKIQANIVRRSGGAGLIGANGFTGNPTGFSNDSTQLRTNFQVGF